ncbi:MAG: pentapeptide repeat-containing protein, partial [Nitrososphaeraceae archaeon]
AKLIDLGEGRSILAAFLPIHEEYGKTLRYGIFTHYLAEGLKGNRDSIDNEGDVTVDLLGNYIYNKMASLPIDKRPKQRPLVHSSGKVVLAHYPSFITSYKEVINENEILLKLLKQGNVAEFNERRLYNHGKSLDFHQGYLKGADLMGADLREVDLTQVDLSECNAFKTDFELANLTGANLTRANLTGANLTRANLREANLTGANLTRANLTGANMVKVEIVEANLRKANLTRANLREANLRGAILYESMLEEANLEGSYITGADLTGADLTGASLELIRNLPISVEEAKSRGAIT